jgi:thymidylate synthase ThyX
MTTASELTHSNTVELLGWHGGDLTHAQSGWTSTNREMTPAKIARIPAFLQMLKDGSHDEPHKTPFEKSYLHFLVRTDIATHIHLIKHRIGVSVNAESARYKELKEDRFYLPYDWPQEWQDKLEAHCQDSFRLYHDAIADLTTTFGMDRKRAKETARYFNPYATQIASDVAFNFSSFIHFVRLRSYAQREIAKIAQYMVGLIMAIDGNPFEHSIKVWGLDTLAGVGISPRKE